MVVVEPRALPALKAIESWALPAVIEVIVGAAGIWATKILVVFGGVRLRVEMALPALSVIEPLFKSRVELTAMPSVSNSVFEVAMV